MLRDLGELASARSLFEKALEIRKKHLGDNNSDTGQVQNNLGLILRDQGDLKAAGGYFELALSIFERVYPGMDQPNTAAALHNLATTRYLQGQYTESERSFSRAHDMRKRIFGHEHPSTVQILYELALTSKAQGKYSDARDYLKTRRPSTCKSARRTLIPIPQRPFGLSGHSSRRRYLNT